MGWVGARATAGLLVYDRELVPWHCMGSRDGEEDYEAAVMDEGGDAAAQSVGTRGEQDHVDRTQT
jgi:hypothetical protein